MKTPKRAKPKLQKDEQRQRQDAGGPSPQQPAGTVPPAYLVITFDEDGTPVRLTERKPKKKR